MAVNKLKVMLSFMREINDGNVPEASDYNLTREEFADIVSACQDEGLIKSATINYASNSLYIFNIQKVKLTVKGMEYLHQNSAAMRTYKGLKEIREWLPF
ncbi:MAG: YjcQ family protein [Eubacteriales bacterium]